MAVTVSPEKGTLIWNHFRKVDSDPDGDGHAAHTGPKYDLNISPRGGIKKVDNQWKVMELTIKVTLNPNKTWVVTGQETDKLLEHERRHWVMDILVGHEMEEAILGLSAATPSDLKEKITKEFEWHRKDREVWLAEKYDDETNHGKNEKAQGTWEAKIDRWYTEKKIPLKTPRN